MPLPLFVSFEGIDGSGKSTQARLLASTLRQDGYDVVEVREPGGTPLGEDVRSLLLASDRSVTTRAELLLFAAARAELIETVIRPAMERGAVVVADRFSDSTVAYQGGGRGIRPVEWIEALAEFAAAHVTPDRTYLIDVPVEDALARRSGADTDRIEGAGRDFYSRVRSAYLHLSRRHPGRIVLLDGFQPIESLRRRVLSDVEALLIGESSEDLA